MDSAICERLHAHVTRTFSSHTERIWRSLLASDQWLCRVESSGTFTEDGKSQVRQEEFIRHYLAEFPEDSVQFFLRHTEFMQCASRCRKSKIASKPAQSYTAINLIACARTVKKVFSDLEVVAGVFCLALLAVTFGAMLHSSEQEKLPGAVVEASGITSQLRFSSVSHSAFHAISLMTGMAAATCC